MTPTKTFRELNVYLSAARHPRGDMKNFTASIAAVFFLLFAFATSVLGSELRLTSVVQPLYLHGSESDSVISFTQVPHVTFQADPEWRFPAIATPFIPPTSGTKPATDVNLVSLYRIAISVDSNDDGKKLTVTIDATKAVLPEGYPFTIEQVIDAAATCVKTMYPPRPLDEGTLEITIKRPKQKGK